MKWLRRTIGVLILLIGLVLLLFPDANNAYISFKSQKIIDQFESENEPSNEDSLIKKVKDYNNSLFENSQENLSTEDADYNPLKDEFLDDLYGTIEIERMNIKIPLYLGASDEHLANGAAIMGETSLPLDQLNTNSVICAHRGWYGCPFFRDIEILQVGDIVKLSTKFGELDYRVREAKVISPYDEESIHIQEGKKMITLSTCHPYGNSSLSNRYIVYCDLVEDGEDYSEDETIETKDESITVTGESQTRILIETWGRRALIILVILLIILCIR